ncbi:rRNA maturation RNase YbeY [Methylocystis heyeri]|uniref:rRNA maturation RNase YbeY n=1 Tax=Methylocystis heyeri TaxID=391905 RepID=UPI00113B0470|nr:rRNA maturation RNase YbeY [Methylocystis heyeri]
MSVEVDILINAPAWEALPELERLASRVVHETHAQSGARLAEDCELCITFCDDEEIRALNAQWRGQDKPTNVLSFPTPGDLAKKPLLGDIVIAFETVAREAGEQDKTLADHTAHMIIHGFLHLIGYDHETPAEAEVMEALERRSAKALGMNDPFAGAELIESAGEAAEPSGSHVD